MASWKVSHSQAVVRKEAALRRRRRHRRCLRQMLQPLRLESVNTIGESDVVLEIYDFDRSVAFAA